MNNNRNEQLDSLTAFRFIAAFMVFIYHLGLSPHYEFGSVGVSFFFILSGFILTYNYHEKMSNINPEKIKKFYIARFAKIYPVHFLTFLISLPITLINFYPHGMYWIKLGYMSIINLLLIQSYFPSSSVYFNFNGVSWTLSIEVLFYLTFPFLLFILSKVKVQNKSKKSLLVITGLWVCLISANLILNSNKPFFAWMLHILPIFRLYEFAVGITLGLFFTSSRSTKLHNRTIFTTLEIISTVILIIVVFYSDKINTGITRGGLFIPFLAALVYIFAHQKGVLSKILSNRIFVYLGEISFSFYMVHQLVIRYYDYFDISKEYRTVMCLTFVIILSSLIYNFYEEPIRKLIRFGKSKKQKSGKVHTKVSA